MSAGFKTRKVNGLAGYHAALMGSPEPGEATAAFLLPPPGSLPPGSSLVPREGSHELRRISCQCAGRQQSR